jgi:hypothetical protein
MKLWVDAIRYLKRGASGGALGFFTHMELSEWNPSRILLQLIRASHLVAIVLRRQAR